MKCQYVVFKAVGIIELAKWKIYVQISCIAYFKIRIDIYAT